MTYWRDFDRFFITLVQRLPDGIQPIMVFASNVGAPISIVAVLLITIAATYMQKAKQLFAAEVVILIFLPLAALIKIITGRERPETLYVENMRFKTFSFPSGHAYASLLVLGFLAYLALKYLPSPWGWLTAGSLGFLIILIGVSRIYLGAHFPTDVIAGWLLGGAVLFLIIKYLT